MERQKTWFSIAFVAPAFLLYTLFIIVPVISSIYFSLTDWDVATAPSFIGLGNYLSLANDPNYWQVLRNTLTLVLLAVVVQIPLGLTFAYLLYLTIRGQRFFRTLYFLPVIVAPIAIGVLFSLLYNGNLGTINKFLDAVGLKSWQHNWLSDKNVVLYSVITPQVWQYIGLFVVIFLAGLRSIPREIFESAAMDGASNRQILLLIAIPLLREIIVICVILAVTGSFRSFDHSWAITRGGPGVASAYVATLMYKTAFLNNQFGYASAITMTIMIYSVCFSVLFRKLVVREAVQY